MFRIVLLYGVAMGYSTVRYVVFAPVNLENLPVFVLNKGISMAAAFCFALAFLCAGRAGRLERPAQQ